LNAPLLTFFMVVTGLVMSRLAKLSARWIGDAGFSFGAGDVTPAAKLQAEKAAAIDENYATVTSLIEAFRAGTLELLPGCDGDQSLEVLPPCCVTAR
jgi:DNA-directed RNA polymerase III subunit RPC1